MAGDRRTDGARAPTPDGAIDTHSGWRVAPDALIFLAGVWLLLAPTLLAYTDSGINAASWNGRILGPAIAIVALLRMVWPHDTVTFSILNILLACWLIAAPFALGYDDAPAAQRNDLITGAFVALLAVTSAWADRQQVRRR